MSTPAPVAKPPMQGGKLALATVAIGLANFMVVLDMTVANVSVPTIAGSIGVSPTQGTWIITSYAVAEAIIVPLCGWLVARFGTVKTFVSAMLGFIMMSAACGLSRSLEMLVFFRILQGLCGGPIMPLSQALLFASYPREKFAVGQGVWAMTTILGPVMGPILGGYISDEHSWPWIFFINVPFGLLTVMAVWRLYKDRETPTRHIPIDRIGLALMVMAIGSMQIVLDKGRELDWFGSPVIIALTVISVVCFTFFIAWELTDKNPIVDLHLFQNREFTIATLTLSLVFAVYFASVVVIPQWLQRYMGYPALTAGLVLASNGVLAMLLAPMIARQVGRIDPRLMVSASMVIFMITFSVRAHFTSSVTFWQILTPQFFQGLAMGLFFLPLSIVALGHLQQNQVASASGLMAFVRSTAAAFAASISTTLWDNQIGRHHAQLVENVTAGNPAVASQLHRLDAIGFSSQQTLAALDQTVLGQAVQLATNDVFAWMVPIFAAAALLIWFTRPPEKGAGPAAAH